MTPERLIEIGILLYGPHWQQPLGVALRVSRRNILRWAAGTAPIPEGVAGELIDLCQYRADKIIEAVTSLMQEAA